MTRKCVTQAPAQSTATIRSGQSGLTVTSHAEEVSRIDQEAAPAHLHSTTEKAARVWDQLMKRKNAIRTLVQLMEITRNGQNGPNVR